MTDKGLGQYAPIIIIGAAAVGLYLVYKMFSSGSTSSDTSSNPSLQSNPQQNPSTNFLPSIPQTGGSSIPNAGGGAGAGTGASSPFATSGGSYVGAGSYVGGSISNTPTTLNENEIENISYVNQVTTTTTNNTSNLTFSPTYNQITNNNQKTTLNTQNTTASGLFSTAYGGALGGGSGASYQNAALGGSVGKTSNTSSGFSLLGSVSSLFTTPASIATSAAQHLIGVAPTASATNQTPTNSGQKATSSPQVPNAMLSLQQLGKTAQSQHLAASVPTFKLFGVSL